MMVEIDDDDVPAVAKALAFGIEVMERMPDDWSEWSDYETAEITLWALAGPTLPLKEQACRVDKLIAHARDYLQHGLGMPQRSDDGA